MPGPNMVLDLGYKAAAAVTQFQAVKLSADDTVTPGVAATDAVIGFAQESCPAADVTAGRVINVRTAGISRAIAGGTVTRGTAGTINTSGQVVAAATGNRVVCEIMTSGVSGDQVNVLIVPPTALIP